MGKKSSAKKAKRGSKEAVLKHFGVFKDEPKEILRKQLDELAQVRQNLDQKIANILGSADEPLEPLAGRTPLQAYFEMRAKEAKSKKRKKAK